MLGTPTMLSHPELLQLPAFNCKMPNWPHVNINDIYKSPDELKKV